MARKRSSNSGVIDLPNDSTDPSKKYVNGKLCFPSLVGPAATKDGVFNSKVPTVQHAHNEISGKGRDDWNNLYNWSDDSRVNWGGNDDLGTV